MRSVMTPAAFRREPQAADRIPYTAHVSRSVIATEQGDYVQVFRLSGASFESADDAQLNTWHERLNVLWRNVASPNVALWTHLIRRREPAADPGRSQAGFAAHLETKYRRRIATETLMVNELYLSLVYRPASGVATSLAGRLLSRARPDGSRIDLADALDTCEKLAQTLEASLARYEPELLSVYSHDGRAFSRALEFLSFLVTGENQRVPLPRAPIRQVLGTSRLFFGVEAIEYRLPTQTRIGAMLGIKEYATPTIVGMFDRLLSAPFAFVLTQSFTFLTKGAGQALLQRQFNRMVNAGDFAVSQAEELRDALDALTSNEFVMGDLHFSVQVLADTPEVSPGEQGARRLKALNDGVALARALLADTGLTVAREDLALEAAFWAQLPGQFAMRPRKAPITSRNFAAMVPFHNYPAGRAIGNHWGDALTLLVTSARSPYHFSLHASDPTDADGGTRKDTGHTFICGPTGSGKTVFVGFLVAMLAQRGVSQVLFDKDRGLEILVRALGGEYQPLRSGEPTGFNPLQLAQTPRNVEFLKEWLKLLARGASPLSTREQSDLEQALRGTLALEPRARRLSRLIEFTDATRSEGIYARLARWCHGTRGDYAWVFDNETDTVVPRLGARAVIGFDVTDFLDSEVTRAPLTLYLFHLVRQLLDGRRLVCWMDEFWRLLSDAAFEGFAKDGPKTWRKLNGVMCLATQSASDVLESPISRTIIEQTPTKVFFPNGDADAKEYMEGFGLTEREFRLIKQELEPGSRMFLVKQGHHSIVCQLDLKGFDGELAVISGRASEVARLHEILSEVGSDPAVWLPPLPFIIFSCLKRSAVMSLLKSWFIAGWAMALLAGAPCAQAQWAVVDVGAIAQLIQQVVTMEQQLSTAKDQLTQARDQFDSMTGGRGMEALLSGTNRNYLPANWSQLEGALRGAAGAYGALNASLQTIMEANAVLTPDEVARLSPDERAHLEAARRSAALLQATSREALATTSQRFASIQSLIAAIAGAPDQKAILDLQARIAAEQGMLQNEQTKLDTLYQVAQSEQWAREQRSREQAIADIGSFRSLAPLGL